MNRTVQNEHFKYFYPWLPVKSFYLKTKKKFDLPILLEPLSVHTKAMSMVLGLGPENIIT